MPIGRSLNSAGQDLQYRIHVGLTTLFCVVMIFYAAFRGQRVITQLPAVFRTTTTPKKLPLDFLNQMFPNNVPSPSFEFPELVICPVANTSLNIFQCIVNNTLGSRDCIRDSLNIETTLNNIKFNKTCAKITGGKVNSQEDRLMMHVVLTKLPQNAPSSVIISTVGSNIDKANGLQVVSAQAWSHNEILVSKLFKIDLQNTRSTAYEIHNRVKPMDNLNITSYFEQNKLPGLQDEADAITNITDTGFPVFFPIKIEVRYPALEVTYEKSFLPLDMNNWLGEVGGVTALIFMLYSAVMRMVGAILIKSGKYSSADYVKGEGFDTFS